MPSMGTLKDPSFGQHFRVMVLCTVLLQMLLQTLSMAVTYVYFTNQMKQLQNKHFRSGLDCLLEEDEDSWSPTEEEIRHCLQTKKQLYQLIEEVTLRTVEETMTTVQEKQLSIPFPPRSRKPQRVAAHITGISRRSSSALTLMPKDGKTLGQKIESWESSRKGHSFLNYLLLRNGELVIQEQGLYYIYSQTYFRFRENEDSSKMVSNRGQNKQMVQYIYKYTSYPDPIMLMKSARNSCWSRDAEYGLYSIYQGGLFELKENDRIFVSVTNEHLMDLDQEASFFGAFLIN
ncbi:tumor necrosis factor ligand superfamily member 10 [Cricetulus griseus]|uniref:Tumor necrosis factor ligand superfamily member n=1 Tax=Cricetulus griseus TaxID=10029 RepID=A0A9J7F2S1_CRIGR|nr:tumor necrosis factor ligand superfamily member 10 [Cricetulus griseus]XP_027247886.1 tumor necrosis factor ligand superfamily member 10 [Cricetulus griseus]